MVSAWRGLTPDPLYCFTFHPPLAGRNLKLALCDSDHQRFRSAVPGQARRSIRSPITPISVGVSRREALNLRDRSAKDQESRQHSSPGPIECSSRQSAECIRSFAGAVGISPMTQLIRQHQDVSQRRTMSAFRLAGSSGLGHGDTRRPVSLTSRFHATSGSPNHRVSTYAEFANFLKSKNA